MCAAWNTSTRTELPLRLWVRAEPLLRLKTWLFILWKAYLQYCSRLLKLGLAGPGCYRTGAQPAPSWADQKAAPKENASLSGGKSDFQAAELTKGLAKHKRRRKEETGLPSAVAASPRPCCCSLQMCLPAAPGAELTAHSWAALCARSAGLTRHGTPYCDCTIHKEFTTAISLSASLGKNDREEMKQALLYPRTTM